MSTITITKYQMPSKPLSATKYGITEKKKAELDHLTDLVLAAQHDVQQKQAIVSSLTNKLSRFDGFLEVAEAHRASALVNWNSLKEILNNITDLKSNSEIALEQMSMADKQMEVVANDVKTVMEELIYTSEVIGKLSNLIIKKKTKNPLISDELISLLGTTGTDANNAVALMLVALKSTFAAHASNMEAQAANSLEYAQSVKLYEILTGTDYKGDETKAHDQCLKSLVHTAYKNAKEDYKKYHDAVKEVTRQLNSAKAALSKSEVKLSSLEAGLAAANAAALAS